VGGKSNTESTDKFVIVFRPSGGKAVQELLSSFERRYIADLRSVESQMLTSEFRDPGMTSDSSRHFDVVIAPHNDRVQEEDVIDLDEPSLRHRFGRPYGTRRLLAKSVASVSA
jgi:hypothetical protein